MRRKAVSPIKAAVAVVAILIILGAAGFAALVFVPGFANQMTQYTGVNFNQTVNQFSSKLGFNMTKPIGVTVETNNATLAKSIFTVNGPYNPSQLTPLVLQPNVTYVFNITIVPVNSLLQPINVPWNITAEIMDLPYINNKENLNVQFAYFNGNLTEITGATPIHTLLTINLPANSNDTIYISTPSGANAQSVVILAKTTS